MSDICFPTSEMPFNVTQIRVVRLKSDAQDAASRDAAAPPE